MTEAIDPGLEWSRLKETFETVDPAILKTVADRPEVFQTMREADTWGRQAKTAFAQQVDIHKKDWVGKEVDRIHLERENMAPHLKPPLPDRPLRHEAHERIDQRVAGVYAQIDSFVTAEKERALTAPKQIVQKQDLSQSQARTRAHPMSKDTHAAMDKSWERLSKRYDELFAGNDSKAVSDLKAEMRAAQKQQHRDVGQAFKAHGITRQPSQTPSQSGPSQ